MLALTLLCTACGNDDAQPTPTDHRWFRTYQTDRTCQSARPYAHGHDERGPTGRAHPF